MKERVLISAASLTALFCVAALLYLSGQIERVRRSLQQESPAAFGHVSPERADPSARTLGERDEPVGVDSGTSIAGGSGTFDERLEHLVGALRFFAAALLLAGVALSVLLRRAWRRSVALSDQSRAAQAQLSTALEALSNGDLLRHRQNRFIATVSHDLRQPLHALGLYLTTLRGHVSTPLGLRILDNASRSTASLNQLLSSVLDVSRLDAEVIEVRPTDLALDGEGTRFTLRLPEGDEAAPANTGPERHRPASTGCTSTAWWCSSSTTTGTCATACTVCSNSAPAR